MARQTCETCGHAKPSKYSPELYVECELARTGYFTCYSSWCPQGRRCKHSTSRYKKQTACKTRYVEVKQ